MLQSDWIQMAAAHDPFDTQRNFTAHCQLAGSRLDPQPRLPGPTEVGSQGYFLGGNRWVRPDRRTRLVHGRARRGWGDCDRRCEGGKAPWRSAGPVLRAAGSGVPWRTGCGDERWRSAMRHPRRGRG